MSEPIFSGDYSADMGTLALEAGNCQFYFDNGYGDGRFKVAIFDNQEDLDAYVEKRGLEVEYAGLFQIMEDGSAKVMDYDCGGEPIYCLEEPGRYPVYRDDGGNMYVGRWE
ncbi:hypothetical protein D6833_05065 [Candidatus Parcubacteria bacterium]|nr:MAG: hypothetical protein D6833_05065 [Candidatus Parcubacteria bacterium]